MNRFEFLLKVIECQGYDSYQLSDIDLHYVHVYTRIVKFSFASDGSFHIRSRRNVDI